ncbi:hypothetical protein BN903_341 [Halorubrum sp. AJ67]|nr:hypothetical protein BN903_341 [Halorubrum sp. AJ67]
MVLWGILCGWAGSLGDPCPVFRIDEVRVAVRVDIRVVVT